MLHDAHNHLQDDWLRPHLDAIAGEARRLGIASMVVNGTSEADWPFVAELTKQFDFVRPSYGIHPWDVAGRSTGWLQNLRDRLGADPLAGVGEIGIDRWILESARPEDLPPGQAAPAGLEEQAGVFLDQLALAVELDRPVSIHCLQAWGRLHELLCSRPLPRRGFLLHAYGGPAEMVPEFVALGAYFSFNGSFLAGRKQRQQAAFRVVPADRLLVETDAPAMPLPTDRQTHPLPNSPEGRPVNHPANLAAAYSGLAELRGESLDTISARISENFTCLFG
jgi:TatD DNase family protein